MLRRGPSASVRDVLSEDQEFPDAPEPLVGVFNRLREQNRAALPVLNDGKLVGMVTLEQFNEMLAAQRGRQQPVAGES